jgi:peptide/nickel transport system substrate-binding protein
MFVIENGLAGWMFYEAFFNISGSRDEQGHLRVTGQQLDDAVTSTDTAVSLHLTTPYPPLLQILAQPYVSILCKKWCIEMGDWPGTWNNWTSYNFPDTTAIETQNTLPPGPHTNAMCGTGPFMLDYYDNETSLQWQLVKFDNYWGGWPANGAGGFLERITGKIIYDWETRKNSFLDGQLDSLQVPRTGVDELLGQPGVQSIYPLEQLECDALLFTFNISTSSPFMGVPGGLPMGTLSESGIPPDFFTDVNVRKGFAYAFNYSKLIAEAIRGEASQPATPILPELSYFNPAQEKYSTDLTKAALCFNASWGGHLWTLGFNFTIAYNPQNAIRQKACEIIKANVESLNPKFHVQILPVPWNNYLQFASNHSSPIFWMGWLADYADPHDFAYAFMYSKGDFAQWQLYSNSTIDALVEQGIGTLNDTARRQAYYDLQNAYHQDCPSVPLYQPVGRRFQRDWVQGWYYNPLLSDNYFYSEWKGNVSTSTRYSWNTFHHDVTHTGYGSGPAPETNSVQWNFTTGGAVVSSPAVADGRIYVGSDDGKVYCFNAYNGTLLWSALTLGPVESSPTVVDGKVYVGSQDATLYCFDALTGASLWNATVSGPIDSSPVVANGLVYFGEGTGGNSVDCFNASTGAWKWSFETAPVKSSPAVAGNNLYCVSEGGFIYCLDALTGSEIWDRAIGLGTYTDSSPAFANGRVYVGSDNRTVFCFDAYTGSRLWSYYTNGTVISSPAVADGKVYVGSNDGSLYCLDALSGAHLWDYLTGNNVTSDVTSSPAVADGKVYFGSLNGKVYCLNASTGSPIWSYATGGQVQSSPAVADGLVFIGSDDNKIYAFGNVIRVPEDYGTIQAAINAAAPGATIWIEPGIYNESLVINKTVYLIGKIGSEPTFNGGGSGIAIKIVSTGSGSIIAGVVITNWDQGLVVIDASSCKVYDNIMSLMSQNAIALQGSKASSNQIYSNIFEQDTVAINLTSSSTGNVICNNIISSSGIGIDVESSGNVVYGNMITENSIAISIQNSNNNKIFHNDFVSNNMQLSISASTGNVWDDGYPSGGNYWACHVSVDSFSGSQQNIPGSDGIVDVPFTVATNNIDHFPLLKPFALHNIGIAYVLKSKTVIAQSFTLRIDTKIQNLGMYNETFTFNCLVNVTTLMQIPISLLTRNCTTLTINWNTTTFPKGNYTLSIVTDPVPDETDTTDNGFSCKIIVTIPGDVNGNFVVDIYDAITLSNSYNSVPPSSNWNPNADINCDNIVDIYDAIILANNYGKIV